MKHGKLYWLSVVATMLIAVGCDESSTSTICTDNTRNCDDVEGATNKCALLQCVFWRSRLTHAHHLWRKRVRRRYYRFVNRHLVSFVISESTNGVYMDWGRFYPRRCWGLLAVLPYGLCSFPSPHIRPQRGRKFPSLINNARRSGRRSPSPFMERGEVSLFW